MTLLNNKDNSLDKRYQLIEAISRVIYSELNLNISLTEKLGILESVKQQIVNNYVQAYELYDKKD